jgi:predicted dehydrogenase
VYTDLAALFSDEAVDVIYIATPNQTHKDLTLQAIKAGKHVLCEKPIGLCAQDVREVMATADESGMLVMEALWSRFIPLYKTVRTLIEQGAIGAIQAVEASFGGRMPYDEGNRFYSPELGGGVLLDLGVYPLSLCQWLLGSDCLLDASLKLASSGVPEDAHLTLRYANQVQANVSASFRRNLRNDMIIYGELGRIEILSPIFRPRYYRLIPDTSQRNTLIPGAALNARQKLALNQKIFPLRDILQHLRRFVTPLKFQSVPYRGNGYLHQIDAFVQALAQGETTVKEMPLGDSLQVLRWIDLAREQHLEDQL